MAVLKVRCPDCNAPIRQPVDPVDQPTDLTIECPECGVKFIASVDTPPAPVKSSPPRTSNPADDFNFEAPRSQSKHRHDDDEDDTRGRRGRRYRDDDDEDDAPKKSNLPLIAGGIGLLALLLGGGVVAAVMALGGSRDESKEVAKKGDEKPAATAPAATSSSDNASTRTKTGSTVANKPAGKPASNKPQPPSNATTLSPTPAEPGNSQPEKPQTTPATGPAAPAGPATGTGSPNGVTANAAGGTGTTVGGTGNPTGGTGGNVATAGPTRPPRTRPTAPTPGLPPLPPPPKLRLNATEDQIGGTLDSSGERPTFISVPLATDEDPFLRAKSYRAEGALPVLPKLPPASQRPILALDSGGHTAAVMNVFFSPKDDKVITVGEDKTVRIWSIKTASTLHTIRFPSGPGREGSLQAAALSSTGRLAVSGPPVSPPPSATPPPKAGTAPKPGGVTPYVVFILSVESGNLIKTLHAAGEVISLHFSADGNRLAVGCDNGTAQVFNIASGAQIGRADPPKTGPQSGAIFEVRFSPDGQSLAILTERGLIRIVDLKTNKTVGINAASVQPLTLAWSQDAQRIAAAGKTGEIKIFDVGNPNNVKSFAPRKHKGEPVHIIQLQFLPGNSGLVCGGTGSWAGVIETDTGKATTEFTAHTNVVTAVAASSDGRLVVSAGGDQNETYVWNSGDGRVVARLAGRGKGIWGIGWSKDGKSIGWGTNKKTDDADGNCPLEQIFRLDDLGPGGPAFQTKFQQAQDTDETYTAIRAVARSRRGLPTIILAFQAGKNKPVAMNIPGEEIFSVSILPGRGKAVIGGGHGIYIYDLQTKDMKVLTGVSGATLSVAPSPDGKYFVTGSSDQTIRIWQPELDEPIMSIFTAGRDWIAWTPLGYYACSPRGEALLSWQINAGPNRLPQVFPAGRFRPSMYQPAIVKYLVPAGTVQYAMAMAQKYDQALVQTTSVADIVPPEATLDSAITDSLQIEEEAFTVKAHARGTGKQPISAMRLLVDGRPFQGKAGIKRFDTPGESADASWVVSLTPGPHTFAVIAETPVSKGMCKPVTIVRKGEVPKPNLYVLAMGISAYPGKMALHYSASDATLLARTLQSRCKGVFANIEVRVITDREATKKGMQAGLDWLASKMTAKDVGIVSFSGHGTRDPQNHFYLVPVDVNPRDMKNTLFSGEEFKSRLDNMPGRLVAILDACHSGDVAERLAPAASGDSLAQELSADDSGVIVMCASLGREYAIESAVSKAGYFTLGLVEGLEGHADVDEDGTIYINELDMYAFARVRQLSHGQQNSTTSMPAGIRPFALATVPKKE